MGFCRAVRRSDKIRFVSYRYGLPIQIAATCANASELEAIYVGSGKQRARVFSGQCIIAITPIHAT